MIDAHCHIDLYDDPSSVAATAERAGVVTILVTNSPIAFERARPHVASFRRLRLALGIHPLEAEACIPHHQKFVSLLPSTSYIGEVGLDFSVAGKASRDLQIDTFAFILRATSAAPKFVSIHSRKAESTVLDLLEDNYHHPTVLHWYSGSIRNLERAVALGHYFSINPAMMMSRTGREIIEAIPRDRLLTETDGPFTRVGGKRSMPSDIRHVEGYICRLWHSTPEEVTSGIRANFTRILTTIRPDTRQTSST